jgi:hypothetical protein
MARKGVTDADLRIFGRVSSAEARPGRAGKVAKAGDMACKSF